MQELTKDRNNMTIIDLIDCTLVLDKNKNRILIMVLEFCDGGTLSDVLKKRKHLPEKEAIEVLHQVTLGLDTIHQRGIVHRDIKADNIFVDDVNKTGCTLYKIGDFGFANKSDAMQS